MVDPTHQADRPRDTDVDCHAGISPTNTPNGSALGAHVTTHSEKHATAVTAQRYTTAQRKDSSVNNSIRISSADAPFLGCSVSVAIHSQNYALTPPRRVFGCVLLRCR